MDAPLLASDKKLQIPILRLMNDKLNCLYLPIHWDKMLVDPILVKLVCFLQALNFDPSLDRPRGTLPRMG